MTTSKTILHLFLVLALCLAVTSALALSAEQQTEFDRIAKLSMADLTKEAGELLEQKYPEEDWDEWDFPQYVYTNDSVETGYRIAVKQPELLKQFPCYCFCDAMGHKNLLHCFIKEGFFGNKFDPHASECNICYGQAMLGLLWDAMGATNDTIKAGFDKKFEQLLEQQQK
jgi:hypothetical protein